MRSSAVKTEPSGSTATMRAFEPCSLKYRPTPVIVPPVPTEMTIASTEPPSVCSQSSGPVVS